MPLVVPVQMPRSCSAWYPAVLLTSLLVQRASNVIPRPRPGGGSSGSFVCWEGRLVASWGGGCGTTPRPEGAPCKRPNQTCSCSAAVASSIPLEVWRTLLLTQVGSVPRTTIVAPVINVPCPRVHAGPAWTRYAPRLHRGRWVPEPGAGGRWRTRGCWARWLRGTQEPVRGCRFAGAGDPRPGAGAAASDCGSGWHPARRGRRSPSALRRGLQQQQQWRGSVRGGRVGPRPMQRSLPWAAGVSAPEAPNGVAKQRQASGEW